MKLFNISILLFALCVGLKVSTAQIQYADYFKGVADYNQSNYNEAIQHFTNALKNSNAPKEQAYELRGKAFLALNQYTKAEQDFIRLSELNLVAGSYCLAQCFAIQGEAAKSVGQLKIHLQQYYKKLKSDILLDPAFNSINNSEEWLALWNGNHYNKTEEQYADAVYHFRNEEYDFALDILDQMIASKSRYHKAYRLRAEILQHKGDYSFAQKDLDKAIHIKKKQADYYAQRAQLFVELEKYKNALKDIEQARKLDPLVSGYIIAEANILTRMGESQKALDLATEYIKLFPKETEAHYIAGKCLYIQKRFMEAVEKFSTCIENDPAQEKFWLARGNVNVAMAQPDKAVNDYSMSLDLDPKQPIVYFSRAFAYQDLNEKDRACKDFKKAFSLGFKEALSHIQEYCGE